MKHITQTEMNINEIWTSNFPQPQNYLSNSWPLSFKMSSMDEKHQVLVSHKLKALF
jgi:hypothetical protein